jgi:hypothetical protein
MWLSELSPVGLLIQTSTRFPLVVIVVGMPLSAPLDEMIVVMPTPYRQKWCKASYAPAIADSPARDRRRRCGAAKAVIVAK